MRIEPDVNASGESLGDEGAVDKSAGGEGVGETLPTPTDDGTIRRFADFATLGEALDYAAEGQRGLNFHDARGKLERAYP